ILRSCPCNTPHSAPPIAVIRLPPALRFPRPDGTLPAPPVAAAGSIGQAATARPPAGKLAPRCFPSPPVPRGRRAASHGAVPPGSPRLVSSKRSHLAYRRIRVLFDLSENTDSTMRYWRQSLRPHTAPGTPGRGSTAEQRFIEATTPEPTTLVFLGSGLLLIALSRIRRRR